MNKIILLGFIARIIVSFWNGFFGPSFGAELDAATFHREATYYSNNLTLESFQIGWIYSYVLGAAYHFTTDSLFLGSVLSSIAWLISAIFLLKTTKTLKIERKNTRWILLLYALLPSSILYTSVTLREPYQLLFITLATYSALKVTISNSKNHWLVLVFSLISVSVLHGALMAFSILLLLLVIFMLIIKNRRRMPWFKIVITSPIFFIIIAVGLSFFSQNAYQIEDGLISSIESYQQGGLSVEARANYKTEIAISGIIGFISFIPTSIFQYMFEPMPWKLSSVVDIPVFLENILRFWLIYLSIKHLRMNKIYSYHRSLFFIFLSYLLIETIWSVGTINWGTASRHHIPSIGLLLIAAFATRRIRNREKNPPHHHRS